MVDGCVIINLSQTVQDSHYNTCTPAYTVVSLEVPKYRAFSFSQNKAEEEEEEEENKEPPKKKEKLMKTDKKAGKLSLKQKASNQPLSQGNTQKCTWVMFDPCRLFQLGKTLRLLVCT